MKLLIITASLITADDKVLLLRRKKDPYRNWWAFPGGKVEFGEDITTAMIREISEETGLSVNQLQFLTTINERVLNADAIENQFVIFYWKALTTFNPAIQNDTREGELKWFNISAVPTSEIVPSDRIILENHNQSLAGFYECTLQRVPNTTKDDLILQEWQ